MNLFSPKDWIPTSITRFYHKGFNFLARTLVRVLVGSFVRYRVSGSERPPDRGPFLLVCNHISHFDPPLLASVLKRKIVWVVALDMYAHPVGAFFFNGIDSIPVDRQGADRKAVREILRRLKNGEPVGIFPEGGIRAGETSILGGQPLDPNVGSIAQLAGVPVVPCVMLGTDKLYAKRAWWWRTTIDFRFGKPVPLPEDPALDNKAVRESVARQVESTMRQLAGELRVEFDLEPRDFPMTAQERWREAED